MPVGDTRGEVDNELITVSDDLAAALVMGDNDVELEEVNDFRDEIDTALDCDDDTDPVTVTLDDKDDAGDREAIFVTELTNDTEVESDCPGEEVPESDLLATTDTDVEEVDECVTD